jgi:uncharacterized protein YxeA
MKKRRTLIISLLLVAALALGIGYAALSRELVIGSTANLTHKNDNFTIEFTSAATDNTPASTAEYSATAASYTITGFNKQGDTATFTYTVENKTTDIPATLKKITQVAGDLYIGEGTSNKGTVSDYFEKVVTVTKGSETFTEGGTAFVLQPGETATVTVKVTLKKTLTSSISLTGASVMLDFSGEN